MTAIKAHFDGKVLIPDEPLDLEPNQRVTIPVQTIPAAEDRASGTVPLMLPMDADIVIDVLRGFAPAIEWLRANAAEQIGISGYAVLKLYHRLVPGLKTIQPYRKQPI